MFRVELDDKQLKGFYDLIDILLKMQGLSGLTLATEMYNVLASAEKIEETEKTNVKEESKEGT